MHTNHGYSLMTGEFKKFKSAASIRVHWPTKIVSTETKLMIEQATGAFRKMSKVFKCVTLRLNRYNVRFFFIVCFLIVEFKIPHGRTVVQLTWVYSNGKVFIGDYEISEIWDTQWEFTNDTDPYTTRKNVRKNKWQEEAWN